jgi:hypothetical protein
VEQFKWEPGIPIVPSLGRLRQEDLEFEARLDNLVRLHLKNKVKKKGAHDTAQG